MSSFSDLHDDLIAVILNTRDGIISEELAARVTL